MGNRSTGQRDVGVCGSGDRREMSAAFARETVGNRLNVNAERVVSRQTHCCGRYFDKDHPRLRLHLTVFDRRIDLMVSLFPVLIAVDPTFQGVETTDAV